MGRGLNGTWRMARRVLPLTTGFVVAIFIAATLYTELLLTDDVDALDIASNSAPSIAALANARGELRALANAAEKVVAQPSLADDEAHTAYQAHRHVIDDALAEYARTPDYPGEHQLYDVVVARLARVDAIVRDDHATERQLAEAVEAVDGAMHALSELNRGYLVSAAAKLAKTGRRRNRYAFVLDALGIAAAFVATVLAARTVERYLSTLARRSRELDHLAIEVAHEIASPLTPIELALGAEPGGGGEAHEASLARARRGVQRIRASLEWLSTFAAAGRSPDAPLPRTPLSPALRSAAHAVGLEVDVDPAWLVGCAEASLQALLADLLSASVTPGREPPEAIAVESIGDRVRVSVLRAPSAQPLMDPFDPQLHVPGTEHPGLDLRLATVRRRVEACGGRVGVRRGRRRERLWIELPRA